MSVNAGFTSRFPPEGWFTFADYSEVQLRAIFRSTIADKGLLLPPRAAAGGVSVAGIVASRLARRIGVKGFGNARDARNKVDAAVKRWEQRVGPAVVDAQVCACVRERDSERERTWFRIEQAIESRENASADGFPPLLPTQAGRISMSSLQYRSLTREDVLGVVPDLNNSALIAKLEKMVGMKAIKDKVRGI
jgi:hypothetical protein